MTLVGGIEHENRVAEGRVRVGQHDRLLDGVVERRGVLHLLARQQIHLQNAASSTRTVLAKHHSVSFIGGQCLLLW